MKNRFFNYFIGGFLVSAPCYTPLYAQEQQVEAPANSANSTNSATDSSAAAVLAQFKSIAQARVAQLSSASVNNLRGVLWEALVDQIQFSETSDYEKSVIDLLNSKYESVKQEGEFALRERLAQAYLSLFLQEELPEYVEKAQALLKEKKGESIDGQGALSRSALTQALLYQVLGEKDSLVKAQDFWSQSVQGWQADKGKPGVNLKRLALLFRDGCQLLKHLPAQEQGRVQVAQNLQEIARTLKDSQEQSGSWPQGSTKGANEINALITQGLLWGMTTGVLETSEFEPSATLAWAYLGGAMNSFSAASKGVSAGGDQVQGEVEALLLCAHQYYVWAIQQGGETATLLAQNPSEVIRRNEVAQVSWEEVLKKLPKATAQQLALLDLQSGKIVPTQSVDNDLDGVKDTLLLKVSLAPQEERKLQLVSVAETLGRPFVKPSGLVARFVPERKDDFVWENDRIAFRCYGPALVKEGARGGIDVWTKSVRRAVANEWYQKGSKFYHTDNGTGLDGYKVGPSLGCGGLGYVVQGKDLVTSPVFATYEVLEQGPLRLRFRLTYGEIEVGNAKVTEKRMISMNAGDHFFTVDSSFEVKGDASDIQPVAGLVVRKPDHEATLSSPSTVAYIDAVMKKKHKTVGVMLIDEKASEEALLKIDDQLLKVVGSDLSKPVRYHAGAVWQKIEASDKKGLENLLKHSELTIKQPILIK